MSKGSPFCPVSDLASASGTVRTIGRTTSYLPAEELVILEEGGHSVTVDVKLLHPFWFKHGAVVQFIGEAECVGSDGLFRQIFKAYLMREMEGLNLDLYLKARKLWMEAFDDDCLEARRSVESCNLNPTDYAFIPPFAFLRSCTRRNRIKRSIFTP